MDSRNLGIKSRPVLHIRPQFSGDGDELCADGCSALSERCRCLCFVANTHPEGNVASSTTTAVYCQLQSRNVSKFGISKVRLCSVLEIVSFKPSSDRASADTVRNVFGHRSCGASRTPHFLVLVP